MEVKDEDLANAKHLAVKRSDKGGSYFVWIVALGDLIARLEETYFDVEGLEIVCSSWLNWLYGCRIPRCAETNPGPQTGRYANGARTDGAGVVMSNG